MTKQFEEADVDHGRGQSLGRAEQIGASVEQVRSLIAEAAHCAHRDPAEIRLLPVTKFHPASDLRILHDLGFTDLAENRVQELRQKSAELDELDINWVLVGHLQFNKAGQAARIVSEVESVDSLRIAEALSSARARLAENRTAPPLRVLLQVNTSGEVTKHGLSPEETPAALDQILALPHLEVAGFMTMAPLTGDESVVRATFARLREIRDQLQARFPEANLRELSMGMSHDFHVAIEEGATTIRLGTALLGSRA